MKYLMITFISLFCANLWAQNYSKPNVDLRKILTNEQYNCTQEEGTEAPFKNAYWNNHADGIYVDVVSGEPLFSSLDKYDSGTGWPSFKKPIAEELIKTKSDSKLGMKRVELRSKNADSHLGHVFDDGPAPNFKRYCINSASLKFIPLDEMKAKGYGRFLFLFEQAKNWDSIVLAGGCFWGMQELFSNREGVIVSEVGYTGGKIKDATYDNVHTGETGHAEAVRILFDPKKTNLKEILFYFFNIHDPTKLNQQGNDIGTQYRSTIFYRDQKQKEVAKNIINIVDKSKKWGSKVVTSLEQLNGFYRAEDYHQDYLKKNPKGYTCHFPRKFKFE